MSQESRVCGGGGSQRSGDMSPKKMFFDALPNTLVTEASIPFGGVKSEI